MSKLSLFYPVKPLHINQGFGSNPDYYARFKDSYGNPEKGHMGVDFMAVHGQPVYAAVDGEATYQKDEHGGEGVYIKTNSPLDYDGGTCWFFVVSWHLIGDTDPKYPLPFPYGVKKQVRVGDLIGYADNTGAPFESSGDHLHFGLIPCDKNGGYIVSANGYGGNIDPMRYFNGQFSVDVLIGLYQTALRLAQQFLTYLQKK